MNRTFISQSNYSLCQEQFEMDLYSNQLNRWSYKICNRGFNLSYNNHFSDGKLNTIGQGYIEDGTPMRYRDDDEFA